MNRKAVIFGIKGYKLSGKQKSFLKKTKPWGIILFSRNIRNISQLRFLINEIKKTFNDKNYPILIDQEGGTVSRLNKIIDLSIFSQYFFGRLYNKNKKEFFNQYDIYINTVTNILKFVGININTVPVLDVKRKNSHKMMSSRCFSKNPNIVSTLGDLCIKLFAKKKIATVIKHIPGHGMSKFDSHYKTPIIKSSKNQLFKKDFFPFKSSKSLFAMTAHIIYESYDKANTATHSREVINKVIRNQIKFKGILISDDLCMKSLKYKLEINALRALEAGCNLVLHCNGNIREMYRLAKVIPKIDTFTQKKTAHFYKFLR